MVVVVVMVVLGSEPNLEMEEEVTRKPARSMRVNEKQLRIRLSHIGHF